MSYQHESASNKSLQGGDSSSKEAMDYRWALDPMVDSDLETLAQDRRIRGSFFSTYMKLIWLWMFVVCACLGAEAFFTFKYGLELFSDVLLKWIASPISVGLFGGAMIQYLVGSRK